MHNKTKPSNQLKNQTHLKGENEGGKMENKEHQTRSKIMKGKLCFANEKFNSGKYQI